MCQELKLEVPYNEMYWKFYELSKFKIFYRNDVIDNKQEEKVQWLEFLLNCGRQKEMPKISAI